ncbi:MAG: hypothetical protein V1782_10105, partial [Pseudomonadota bacterium]
LLEHIPDDVKEKIIYFYNERMKDFNDNAIRVHGLDSVSFSQLYYYLVRDFVAHFPAWQSCLARKCSFTYYYLAPANR